MLIKFSVLLKRALRQNEGLISVPAGGVLSLRFRTVKTFAAATLALRFRTENIRCAQGSHQDSVWGEYFLCENGRFP